MSWVLSSLVVREFDDFLKLGLWRGKWQSSGQFAQVNKVSELSGPSAWIRGWYVGRVSHENQSISIQAGQDACSQCQGTSEFENSEGVLEYCSHEDGTWIDIMDTDFRV
jgi:hypothetical protein